MDSSNVYDVNTNNEAETHFNKIMNFYDIKDI